MPKETKVEQLLKSEKVKILEPNACALIYDQARGLLIGVCNKDGELKVSQIEVPKK